MSDAGQPDGAGEGAAARRSIGLLMALGSISYVLALSKLPVGTAAAISTSYVVLVVVLSRLFLGETLSWLKIGGLC